jgi:hypothetical protein
MDFPLRVGVRGKCPGGKPQIIMVTVALSCNCQSCYINCHRKKFYCRGLKGTNRREEKQSSAIFGHKHTSACHQKNRRTANTPVKTLQASHRHLSNIDCLKGNTTCLVYFISTVNGHRKKDKAIYFGLSISVEQANQLMFSQKLSNTNAISAITTEQFNK